MRDVTVYWESLAGIKFGEMAQNVDVLILVDF